MGSHPESAGHLFDLVNRQARVISWYAVFMIRWRLSALQGSAVLTRNSILLFRAGLSRTSLIPSIRLAPISPASAGSAVRVPSVMEEAGGFGPVIQVCGSSGAGRISSARISAGGINEKCQFDPA